MTILKRHRNDFWRRYKTVDETWIQLSTPETKQQSINWVFQGEYAPKKAKAILSANKVTATVVWDIRRIIHIDYLERAKQLMESIMSYYLTASSIL